MPPEAHPGGAAILAALPGHTDVLAAFRREPLGQEAGWKPAPPGKAAIFLLVLKLRTNLLVEDRG